MTGRATYLRFHGSGTKYGGNYPNAHLKEWAEWINDQRARGFDAYAYFNNDAEGYAVTNALTLRKLCGPPAHGGTEG